ncbi:MAG: hypothetical protein ACRDOH_23820 [Streptosporangiaceae bacterium]
MPSPEPFSGGGLTIPWGIAVDGNDNVWVANFGGQRVSEFCGAVCPRTAPRAPVPASRYPRRRATASTA